VATTPPPQQKENASRSSAANSKKRGSGTLDAFLPLHAARAKRLQQHAAAAATAAAAPFARLAGARATAPAAVVPARAAAAAPAPAAAAAAPAAVNPASGSSSRSPSLVEKIKSRYEQIYADYADSLSGNAAPPSGANLANLSWMNIRYKVRAAVQVRVHKSLSFCAAFFAVSDAKPIMAKQAPGADTLTQVHSHNMCFVVFSLSAWVRTACSWTVAATICQVLGGAAYPRAEDCHGVHGADGAKNASFCNAIWCLTWSFYQDRLGTNIGKALKKESGVFSFTGPPRCAVAWGCHGAKKEPFIYKNEHFTKTGSGQT
jgi:hypothetical protein